LKPIALCPGDPVGVVAVSGPVSRGRIERGIGALRDWGHPVDPGAALLARRGFLAGADAQRAADLDAAIHRRDLPGILFARGGWGAARILDRVDLAALRARPRVLLGYSDVTSLFMALQRPGRPYPVRYGPTVAELGEPRAYHGASLREALYLPSDRIEHGLAGCRILRPGRASGILTGGCLALLVGMLGTPYDASWDGCILFWEDLNEEPFRIDRMLNHLRLAGKLKNLAGMIVGRLRGCRPKPPTPGLPLKEILLEATAGTSYPIVLDFPCGHIPRKRTLLMGVPAEVDTGRRSLVVRVR
jgi:muramoyltetrapeptide carboxypeptidase